LKREDSIASQVADLKPGEVFSRSRFLSSATPRDIQISRRVIVNYLTKVSSRAREKVSGVWHHIHTAVGVTQSGEVIVTGVIVAEEENNEI